MPDARREGDKVILEMTFLEYRDLTEVLTAAGNEAWRHAKCTEKPHIMHVRGSRAQAAWEWSNGMGIPPLNDGQSRTFDLEPFKYLAGNASVRWYECRKGDEAHRSLRDMRRCA